MQSSDDEVPQASPNRKIDQMQSAKMIYQNKKLAGEILNKMKRRHPNDDWDVMVVPTGFQVTRTPKPLFGSYWASCTPHAGAAKPAVPVGTIATVTLHYSNQSPHFIECFHGGKKIWFAKTTLIGFDVNSASNTIVMKMPVKYAKKRGLI
jgi:hypothetical protein